MDLLSIDHAPCRRAGVSALEVFGCMAAMLGGIMLGSMYLGIDLQSTAVEVLEQTDLVNPAALGLKTEEAAIEESAAETSELAETATADDQAATDEGINPALAAALAAPQDSEETALPLASEEQDATPQASPQTETTSPVDLPQATQAAWKRLNDSLQSEAAGRNAVTGDPSNWQLFDYLTQRRKGHQQVVAELEQIDKKNIDQRLVSHIEQVLAWHRTGESLFDRALVLLTDGPSAQLTGPTAQSWQSAATQHRMEEKLLMRKHVVVATYLEHTYLDAGPFKPSAMP